MDSGAVAVVTRSLCVTRYDESAQTEHNRLDFLVVMGDR